VDLAPSAELLPEMEERARRIGTGPMMVAIGRLEEVHAALEQNAAPRLALEAAMLAWPSR
ncbi:MAG: hypothetical protein ACRDGJ_11405, partial [Candidatus Limnocylindria bacterium]